MSSFTLGTFNVKNLIGADQEYYKWERYTQEEHAWKQDWLSDQLLSMDADIVGFQEIFEDDALAAIVAMTNTKGEELNEVAIPDPKKRYSRKMIFRRLKYTSYPEGGLAFLPNIHDTGEPGNRRPGLAILSRHPFIEPPVAIQDISDDPIEMRFDQLGGGDAGSYRLTNVSRPIVRARIDVDGRAITVFNCHLKSKLGEFEGSFEGAPEKNLLDYDPVGRAIGEARSLIRRAAEAAALRRLVVDELKTGAPVVVMGDLNDSENAVSSAIIAGERPFKNYAWLRRHDATKPNQRYTDEENDQIQTAIRRSRLLSAEKMFIRQSLRDMIYTSAFGGVYESIDQILLSHHFQPDAEGQEFALEYLQCFNDHLTDGGFEEAPYNKLASDHGQLVATIRTL
jgi:hypothetical protein